MNPLKLLASIDYTPARSTNYDSDGIHSVYSNL